MITNEQLRVWWWQNQALGGERMGESSAQVLASTGWARSVGGVAPYLTLRARNGASRDMVDEDVKRRAVYELPSARGCTYVIPEGDYALALKLAQPFNEKNMRPALKLGVTERELNILCDAVLGALEKEALEPGAIRKRVGDKARSLGEEGRRKGVSSTTPLALGLLQVKGLIRRVPTTGRLDQQRYKYALWKDGPDLDMDQQEAHKALALRFFQWTAPATIKEFCWFSGMGVRAAKEAIKPIGLVGLPGAEEYLLSPEQLERLASCSADESHKVKLISNLDALFLLRRNVMGFLSDDAKGSEVDLGKRVATMGSLSDLPCNAIVDQGLLIGLWEYDFEHEEIVWFTFSDCGSRVDEAVQEMELFIRSDLGDARSFSLDSPARRAPRIAAIRRMASSSRW